MSESFIKIDLLQPGLLSLHFPPIKCFTFILQSASNVSACPPKIVTEMLVRCSSYRGYFIHSKRLKSESTEKSSKIGKSWPQLKT